MRHLQRIRMAAAGIKARFMRPGPIVLLYHRIAAPDRDPFRLAVSPVHFAEQVAVMSRRCDIVPLDQLLQQARGGGCRSCVAITFDDGYVDNLEVARPILARIGAPATVFVATGFLGREFWWDALERIIFRPGGLPPTEPPPVTGRPVRSATAAALARGRRGPATDRRSQDLFLRLHRLLTLLTAGQRGEALAHLADWAGEPLEVLSGARALRPEEVSDLAADGLIRIGAHTVDHPRLSALPEPEQQEQIRASLATVEALAGMPSSAFAYPYGQPGDFDGRTRRCLRALGVEVACAASPGVVGPRTDPLQVPRIWVEDWHEAEFARLLDAWLPSNR
jgi:peptidoglycan/xylan/chitin deacetylase (PgdA/CDA1 family)